MKVVYTAIMGSYDLPQRAPQEDGWDCIAFTDTVQTAFALRDAGWDPVIMNPKNYSDPVRMARHIKTCPHIFLIDYQKSIWIDGNLKLTTKPEAFWNEFAKRSFNTSQHPLRNCVYQEAAACISLKKDEPDTITRQVNTYRKKGFPENFGLIQSGVILRKNTKDVRSFGEAWYQEILCHSRRDQLSFPWILHNHPLSFHFFPWNSIYPKHIQKKKHTKPQPR